MGEMRKPLALTLAVLMVLLPAASAYPTPGFNGPEAREVTDRIFPEARETNDFVSYQEARDGLQLLEEENPDLIEFVDIGPSRGWVNPTTSERDPSQVFAVLVTHEDSGVPEEERINVVFQMSIHGNEKGGREGALRVVEDFVLAENSGDDVGVATQDRVAMLDRMRLIFTFPNPDGWTHEELEYRWNDGCNFSATCAYGSGNTDGGGAGAETQWYVRGNGNGTDLNRQSPLLGFLAPDHRTLEEPEVRAEFQWLKERFHDVQYAADIHGMIDPADAGTGAGEEGICTDGGPLGQVCTRDGHFILGLLPAAPQDPVKDRRMVELATRANEYVNDDPAFDWWRTLPPANAVGGEVGQWGTVWDTLGYTDTGFTGDWMAQPHGLDAVGVYYEYAYNHIAFDNHYAGPGQEMNRLHVAATRDIVGAFMDVAWEQSVEDELVGVGTGTNRVGYVPTDVVRAPPEGELPDHAKGFKVHDRPATPNAFFEDIRPALDDPDKLERIQPSSLPARLESGTLDALVVPGSAADQLDAEDLDAIEAYVRDGGRLVVTDQALTALPSLGLEVEPGEDWVFAGHTNPRDEDHFLMKGVEGLARQLVEPIPLGYPIPGNNQPIWSLNATHVEDAGGSVVGTSPEPYRATLGTAPLGDGTVVFIGSLLPDPVDEEFTYGQAGYATTYTGHQVFRNAVGWSVSEDVSPAGMPDGSGGPAGGQALPGPGAAALVAALVAALWVVRRRRA